MLVTVRLVSKTKATKQSRIVGNVNAPPVAEIAKNIHILAILLWVRRVALAFHIAADA